MGSEIVIDDFLDDFDGFRRHLDGVSYDGETNQVDGVFYPGVSTDIPPNVKLEIIHKLQAGIGKKISPTAMFVRLSPEGIETPHQAHTDVTMGQYGFMLYLNRLKDCLGGTSFVRHKKTGLSKHPINDKQVEIWERDHSNSDEWAIYEMCDMMPNRACVFDASLMHRSEPVGGFGKYTADARLVLVMFFDIND